VPDLRIINVIFCVGGAPSPAVFVACIVFVDPKKEIPCFLIDIDIIFLKF
jgi:hypothetical protein